jgi:hypothetical protein
VNKREKIIVALMVVVVLVALISFIPSPFSGKADVSSSSQARLTELRELATKISEEVNKEDLTKTEKVILERADTAWSKDPFIGKSLTAAAEPGRGQARDASFSYTGFIDTGTKRLAVINGMEYEVGEMLQSGGYVVRVIDPGVVVLEGKEKQGKISVPYSGQIF